ncbi:hypothetical protein RJ640_023699 [Escallonia rubra]|uniref:Uncharacterized protein n=1 Tax=Escallonia rubra TaxID=112253 RepID=A0AA88UBV8_9ASTE|nr:hypothetical protein RJ640_023699 [Escallonia rubra]
MFIAKTSGLLSSQEAEKMMGNGNSGMQAEPSETEGSLLEAEVSKESDHHHVAALMGEEDGEKKGGEEEEETEVQKEVLTSKIFSWLDTCGDQSVVYVCFGSQAVLTNHQMEELASGLEKSGGRFIWRSWRFQSCD